MKQNKNQKILPTAYHPRALPRIVRAFAHFLSLARFAGISLAVVVGITLAASAGAESTAATSASSVQLEEIIDDDDTVWGFAFLNENEILYTKREGELRWLNLITKQSKVLPSPKVHARGQGGLLDVKIAKQGEQQIVFITFSEYFDGVATTTLARADWNASQKTVSDFKPIFRAKVQAGANIHFGSRLAFQGDAIFMTVGDRSKRDLAQSRQWHNGSILRLDYSGNAYKKNTASQAKSANNDLPEIFSIGHRNPQGIDFDPVTGNLYSCEFGPLGGDELNRVEEGKNYGWPLATKGREYTGGTIGKPQIEGMQEPVTFWSTSETGARSLSPSGMVFYRGDKIKKWKNHLFLTGMVSRQLRRVVLRNNTVIEQEPLFENQGKRFRHVENGPDGYLYVSTDGGEIFRIVSK